MNISWLGNNENKAAITIYKNNIVLNKMASDFFKDAYCVAIGVDDDSNNIIIQNVNKQESEKFHCPFYSIKFFKSFGRISGKNIIDELIERFKFDFDKNLSFKLNAKYNIGNKMLIVETGGIIK